MEKITAFGVEFPESVLLTLPMARNYVSRFDKHELTVIEPYDPETKRGEYRWGDKNTGMYLMYIIFRPSTIIVHGDMHSLVLRQEGIDLAWLRKAITSPNYLFEKQREHKKEFDREASKKLIHAYVIEHEDPPQWEKDFLKIYEQLEFETPKDVYEYVRDKLGWSNPEEYIVDSWRETGIGFVWGGIISFLQALGDD